MCVAHVGCDRSSSSAWGSFKPLVRKKIVKFDTKDRFLISRLLEGFAVTMVGQRLVGGYIDTDPKRVISSSQIDLNIIGLRNVANRLALAEAQYRSAVLLEIPNASAASCWVKPTISRSSLTLTG